MADHSHYAFAPPQRPANPAQQPSHAGMGVQQGGFQAPEPSVQNIRSTIHRPLSTTQQQFIQSHRNAPPPSENETLREFINQLGEYAPTIPDSVTRHFLNTAGVCSTDARVTRLLALASQKHVSDIVLDAMQNARMKGVGQTKKGTKETKFTLTEDLLDNVLGEYGVQMLRPPYHA